MSDKKRSKDKPKDKKKKRKAGRPKGSKNKPKDKTKIKEKKKDKDRSKKSKKKSKVVRRRLIEDEKIMREAVEAVLGGKLFSVKFVATISKVNDGMRGDKIHFEIMKDGTPPSRPCEKPICKITYEETGVLAGPAFKRARAFTEAFIKEVEKILKSKST